MDLSVDTPTPTLTRTTPDPVWCDRCGARCADRLEVTIGTSRVTIVGCTGCGRRS